MTAALQEIGMLTHSEITAGVDIPFSELDAWKQEAQGWTIRLCSDLSSEYYGPGNWPAFHYWKGPGHKGKPPTVADLIASLIADAAMLRDCPEELDYPTGKAIEHNVAKCHRLFGFQFWEQRISHYSEEEITEAFGEMS